MEEIGLLTVNEPEIVAEPVNGNGLPAGANDADVANEAVPSNEPVNPTVAVTEPVTTILPT